MELEIHSTEFSIGRILSESWKKFKENFQSILLITLIVYIPINTILSFVPIDRLMEQLGTIQGFKVYLKIIQILEALIGIIATMAIACVIKSNIDGKTVSLGQALQKSISRWPAALATNLLLGLFLIGLLILFIVPGVIYSGYWVFTLYSVVLYDKFGKAAMNHSKAIVKDRWWTVAGYASVFFILNFAVGIILAIPFWILPDNFLTDIISDTVLDVVSSYFTVVFVIFFINFDSTKKSTSIP